LPMLVRFFPALTYLNSPRIPERRVVG